LTEEGIEKTKQVAKGIAALGVHADLMVSSPYVRAMQTATIFASALEYPKQKIRGTESLLPGADPAAVLRELAREKKCIVGILASVTRRTWMGSWLRLSPRLTTSPR